MKYSILINQLGVVKAGLQKTTDMVDWALLEYVADWQVHGGGVMLDDHVWLNYQHLIDEMPLLGLNKKNSVANRVKKLIGLDLLTTRHDDDGRCYAKVTRRYSEIVRFRPDGETAMSIIRIKTDTPVPREEHPVPREEHTINNQLITNQEQTKLNARENEKTETALSDALQWAQFFIRECGYPIHIVQTSKTIPLFAQWVRDGVTVSEMRQVMAACHAWNGDRVPDSPLLYGKFLQSLRDSARQLAQETTFADRPGAGRNRNVEDWAKVPRDDDQLWPWAKKHGYPGPGSMTYRQYRARLHAAVESKRGQSGHG